MELVIQGASPTKLRDTGRRPLENTEIMEIAKGSQLIVRAGVPPGLKAPPGCAEAGELGLDSQFHGAYGRCGCLVTNHFGDAAIAFPVVDSSRVDHQQPGPAFLFDRA